MEESWEEEGWPESSPWRLRPRSRSAQTPDSVLGLTPLERALLLEKMRSLSVVTVITYSAYTSACEKEASTLYG